MFTTATIKQDVAKAFMTTKESLPIKTEKVLIEIQLIGKGGKDISYLSKVASEDEVLLMPGTKCRYTGDRYESDYHVMTYTEV